MPKSYDGYEPKKCECEISKLDVLPCDTKFYCICGREFEAWEVLPRFWKDYHELVDKVQKLEKDLGKHREWLRNQDGNDNIPWCDV